MFDKIGFKKVYLIIAVINIICTACIGYINGSYAGYFIILCITMCCEGGLFSCYPAVSAKIFGHKVYYIYINIGWSNYIWWIIFCNWFIKYVWLFII